MSTVESHVTRGVRLYIHQLRQNSLIVKNMLKDLLVCHTGGSYTFSQQINYGLFFFQYWETLLYRIVVIVLVSFVAAEHQIQ